MTVWGEERSHWGLGVQVTLCSFQHLWYLHGRDFVCGGESFLCMIAHPARKCPLKGDSLCPFVLGWEGLLVNKYILIMYKDWHANEGHHWQALGGRAEPCCSWGPARVARATPSSWLGVFPEGSTTLSPWIHGWANWTRGGCGIFGLCAFTLPGLWIFNFFFSVISLWW